MKSFDVRHREQSLDVKVRSYVKYKTRVRYSKQHAVNELRLQCRRASTTPVSSGASLLAAMHRSP